MTKRTSDNRMNIRYCSAGKRDGGRRKNCRKGFNELSPRGLAIYPHRDLRSQLARKLRAAMLTKTNGAAMEVAGLVSGLIA